MFLAVVLHRPLRPLWAHLILQNSDDRLTAQGDGQLQSFVPVGAMTSFYPEQDRSSFRCTANPAHCGMTSTPTLLRARRNGNLTTDAVKLRDIAGSLPCHYAL